MSLVTKKNIQDITNEINYFFEKKITEDPGQYFWLHDRWKQNTMNGIEQVKPID